jgi:hypothetical protein
MNAEMYLAVNSGKFPSSRIMEINDRLNNLSENEVMYLQSVNLNNPTTFLLLYLFCPFFCLIDRFFTGQTATGVVKLLTLGGLGVWTIVDIFLIMGRVKQHNYNKVSNRITGI